jgi:MtN3 and saliva related transmembrane protein
LNAFRDQNNATGGRFGEINMTILGLIAGTCTTLSFLPQVIRTLRTRHARDLSAAWLLIFGLGAALWLTYGLLKSNIAIALANGVTFGLVMVFDRRQVHDGAAGA